MRTWIAGALMLAVTGCTGAHRVFIVSKPPPQPQYEAVQARPGYVWVKGAWASENDQWVWQPGHYETERTGAVWRDGYWEPREDRWHWVEGHWEAGEGGEVHDHRAQQ